MTVGGGMLPLRGVGKEPRVYSMFDKRILVLSIHHASSLGQAVIYISTGMTAIGP